MAQKAHHVQEENGGTGQKHKRKLTGAMKNVLSENMDQRKARQPTTWRAQIVRVVNTVRKRGKQAKKWHVWDANKGIIVLVVLKRMIVLLEHGVQYRFNGI